MGLAGDEVRVRGVVAELCSGEQAQLFARGLTLCHLDAVLGQQEQAQRLLPGAIDAELARRGVDGTAG